MGKLIDAAALMDALWQVHHHDGDSPEAEVYMEDVGRIVDKMPGGLSEQEQSDVDNIRRIRGERALKIITHDYTIANEAWLALMQQDEIAELTTERARHGRWICRGDYAPGMWECDVCRKWCMVKGNVYRYCPSCGARMEVDDD